VGVKISIRQHDCGAKIGVGLQIGAWRRAWSFRNPFFNPAEERHRRMVDFVNARQNDGA
jgi:hypothetical protein